MMRESVVRGHRHNYPTTTESAVPSEYNCCKILACGNDGEEENIGPDIGYDGGFEFFASDSASKEGIWGHHNVGGGKTRGKDVGVTVKFQGHISMFLYK